MAPNDFKAPAHDASSASSSKEAASLLKTATKNAEVAVTSAAAADATQPIISEADWAAYWGRGIWLPLSWALAIVFVVGAHAVAEPRWPAFVEAVPNPMWRFILCVALPNTLLTLLGNLFFLVLYWGQFPWAEKHKINKSRPWPWMSANAEERARFWEMLPWSIGRVVFNHASMVPLLIWQYWMYSRFGMFHSGVDGFPTLFTLVWQLAVCIIVEDTIFYAVHRTLHHPALYPYIHKVHHQYYHPIALASEHAHILEFMFGNGLPVIVGPQITCAHSFTFMLWILIRISTSIDNHCGYAFPLTPVRLLPFGSTAEGHDYHHSKNDGMLVSEFVWFDVLGHTLGKFQEWKRKKVGLPALA